jgi:hypothetical protein
MKHIQRISAVLLAVMMLLSLCACGSRNYSKQTSTVSGSAANSSYSYDVADYAMEEAMMADGDMAYGFSAVPMAASSTNTTAARGTESEAPSENPDKIIYSADVTVETTAFDETIGQVSALVEEFGGWIEASSVSGSNYYQKARGTASTRDASFTLRIPSGRFQELMDSLSGLGNIPYSHIYTENVTAQYYDVQAHLKAYQTQETRLLEMMELAETVEDVITIEDRLTELRYQIESLQSRLNNWDRRVSYSTIALSVKEVREYTPEEKVNPTFGEELAQALKDGLENAGQFLKDLLVLLVEALPVLLLLIPIVWLVIWLLIRIIRKIAGKAAAKREAKRAAKAAAKAGPAATPERTEKTGNAP